MPLFNLTCPTCHKSVKRLMTPKEFKDCPPMCLECAVKLVREARGPSNRVVERLDNGVMPRAVERLFNAEELFAARAKDKP